MKRRLVNLFARGIAPGVPIVAPTRALLWSPGPVRGDFPTNIWDAEAARSVMAAYLARALGDPSIAYIPIDVEHGTNPKANPLYDASKPPPGGGYAQLRLDEQGALWLDPIQWSDYGRSEIESGSRRAISPDWEYDPATGRPVALHKVSLVQNAGTYGLGLVASAATGEQGTMDPIQMLLIALRAANQGDAENPQITALIDAYQKQVDATPGAPAGDGMPLESAAPCGPDGQPLAGAAPLDMQKAIAAAVAMIAAMGPKAKPATAGAQEPSLSRAAVVALVANTVREENQKAALIASAALSPAFTPALGVELSALPLGTVVRIVKALPKPAPASEQAAAAAATASATQAATAGVKPAQIPGAAAATESAAKNLTASEDASIALINQTGMTDAERTKKYEADKALAAAAGVGMVSGLTQVERARVRVFGNAKPN